MFEMYILKKEKKLRGKDAVAEYVFFNKKYLRSKEYVKCIFVFLVAEDDVKHHFLNFLDLSFDEIKSML